MNVIKFYDKLSGYFRPVVPKLFILCTTRKHWGKWLTMSPKVLFKEQWGENVHFSYWRNNGNVPRRRTLWLNSNGYKWCCRLDYLSDKTFLSSWQSYTETFKSRPKPWWGGFPEVMVTHDGFAWQTNRETIVHLKCTVAKRTWVVITQHLFSESGVRSTVHSRHIRMYESWWN